MSSGTAAQLNMPSTNVADVDAAPRTDLKPFSRVENDPRPSIGKVFMIGTIAAVGPAPSRPYLHANLLPRQLALTTGATIAVIPGLRARQRSTAARSFQFVANRSLDRPNLAPAPARTSAQPPRPLRPAPLPLRPATATAPQPATNPVVAATAESAASQATAQAQAHAHASALAPPEEPISPLFAIKAFAIATALVTGSAAVVSVGVARLLGVQDVRRHTNSGSVVPALITRFAQMTEFTQSMRKWTASVLPEMSGRLYKAPDAREDGASPASDPPPPGYVRTQEDSIVGGWFADVVRGAEEERQEIIRARGLGGEAQDVPVAQSQGHD